MRDFPHFRRYELAFLIGTATLYVVRRLVDDLNRIDGLIGLSATGNGIAAGMFRDDLATYDHTLNNNVPIIAGVCLFLAAWFVFHNLTFPLLNDRTNDRKAGLYTGLTVLLLLASVFIYHYLKIHVRYQHDQAWTIIGLKTYSLYRKRTVLADAVGLGIVLGAYEVAFQYYQFLARKITVEAEQPFRFVSYLLLGGLSLLAVNVALNGHFPPTLWQGGTRDVLLMLGLIIQMLVLQSYVYTYTLPILRAPRTSETLLLSRIATVVLTAALATTILWGAATKFYYRPLDPILSFAVIVVIGSFAIAYGRQWLSREKTALQTQVSAKAAELSSLRAQINPHFLFNALNSLYATALKENSEKTADGIQKLGDMMRFMLQENNLDRIPLDKEVEYLHNYIQIQRMRIDETHDIEIRVNIQEPVRVIYIAPMLLTPFVENAFKHGISFRSHSWIYITLTLDDTRLYLKVHNSRHPKPPDDPEEAQPGVGLDNVRKRLNLIYPGRHQLDIQQSGQDYFVSLTLIYW